LFPAIFQRLACVWKQKKADLTVPRQKEHNNMCLAIEKMKEKGRQEELRKTLKAIERLDVVMILY